MARDRRVQQLLEELLDCGGTPEEVCRACPELLPQVHEHWQRLRNLRAEVDMLFPTPLTIPATIAIEAMLQAAWHIRTEMPDEQETD